MYILAFDTTGAQCAVILRKDNVVVDRFVEYMDFGQAEVLIPQIKKMLEKSRLSFSDINLIAVCVGPGSFTGVRASIAAARAFSIALPHLAVDGVSAFEAYARSLEPEQRAPLNAVIIETKRADFYVQLFDAGLERLSAPQVLSYDEIIDELRYKKVSLTGDGVERFLNKPSGLSLHCIKMPPALAIEDVADCAFAHYKEKRLDFPKPLYLRAPDVSAPKGG